MTHLNGEMYNYTPSTTPDMSHKRSKSIFNNLQIRTMPACFSPFCIISVWNNSEQLKNKAKFHIKTYSRPQQTNLQGRLSTKSSHKHKQNSVQTNLSFHVESASSNLTDWKHLNPEQLCPKTSLQHGFMCIPYYSHIDWADQPRICQCTPDAGHQWARLSASVQGRTENKTLQFCSDRPHFPHNIAMCNSSDLELPTSGIGGGRASEEAKMHGRWPPPLAHLP